MLLFKGKEVRDGISFFSVPTITCFCLTLINFKDSHTEHQVWILLIRLFFSLYVYEAKTMLLFKEADEKWPATVPSLEVRLSAAFDHWRKALFFLVPAKQ